MVDSLNTSDFELLLESLEYTKFRFENTQYPTYELRQSQLERVNTVIEKVRDLKNKLVS